MFILLLLLTISFISFNQALIDISCKNEENESVDWFYLYKLPKLVYSHNNNKIPYLNNGSAYVYMTESNQKWRLSDYSINETQSLPGLTLDILYKNISLDKLNEYGIGYIYYNDQAESITLIKGHTKGVLLFDSKSAVWIVHSIPHFPPKINSNRYYINSSQLIFGQSMLCITVKFETLEQIGKQMLYNYPQIYDYYIPQRLIKGNNLILDNLMSVLNGNHVNKEPWYNLNVLETLNKNYRFLSFAKYTNFNDDLYTILVAQQLKSNLATETWNNGAGTLPSNCSFKYSVFNIEHINLSFLNVTFSVHNDHSKWAVSVPIDENRITIVCVGDINRQIEQFKRAGGTLCLLDNENIWKQYFSLVKNYDTCKNFKRKV